mgnify:CR=1 FL=1
MDAPYAPRDGLPSTSRGRLRGLAAGASVEALAAVQSTCNRCRRGRQVVVELLTPVNMSALCSPGDA